MLRNFNLMAMLYSLPGILLALSVHEFAHAYMAYKLGDNTAKSQGRLTLDPIAHIDPVGFLMLLFAGFGWAKPVMVNKRNFKHPVRDDNLVSLAGPVSNFILAIIFTLVLKIMYMFNLQYVLIGGILINVVYGIIIINVGLGIFNLIPIPPLDGSHVLFNMLPSKYYYQMMQNYHIIQMIFIILFITGILGNLISPLISGMLRLLGYMFNINL